MNSPQDGGAAFPHSPFSTSASNWSDGSQGMTLRDWFAGMALPSVYKEGVGEITETEIALDCYRIADAMLAARGKEAA